MSSSLKVVPLMTVSNLMTLSWKLPTMLIQTFVIRLRPLEHTTRPRQYYFVGRVRMRDHVRNDRYLMLSRVFPVLGDV